MHRACWAALCVLFSLAVAHDIFFDLEDKSPLLNSIAHEDVWYKATSKADREQLFSKDQGLSFNKMLSDAQDFEASVSRIRVNSSQTV